ncbi:MAG: hypothetical protein Fur0032_14310 [Terrimicrobiaceae bacterium]
MKTPLDGLRGHTSTRTLGRAAWTLMAGDEAESTNDLARGLPAWSAVMAGRQTGGRGRFGRRFVSDAGGLYLTAVLPAGGAPSRWSGFSLAAGHWLQLGLARMGVASARLRWPNDLMVGQRKLGGLLIEQSPDERLWVGLGLNVTNEPWLDDPMLRGTACRLADFLFPVPAVEDLAVVVLDALADAHDAFSRAGLGPVVEALNAGWSRMPVELETYETPLITGIFAGLDPLGNVCLIDQNGEACTVPHAEIRQFREIFQ